MLNYPCRRANKKHHIHLKKKTPSSGFSLLDPFMERNTRRHLYEVRQLNWDFKGICQMKKVYISAIICIYKYTKIIIILIKLHLFTELFRKDFSSLLRINTARYEE